VIVLPTPVILLDICCDAPFRFPFTI